MKGDVRNRARARAVKATLDSALSESGCITFAAISQPLVTELCEIIGSLHRALESKGMTSDQIREHVGNDLTGLGGGK